MIGFKVKVQEGNLDPSLIGTSYVERSNLTLRIGMRRYMRKTNGLSKKLEKHAAMLDVGYGHVRETASLFLRRPGKGRMLAGRTSNGDPLCRVARFRNGAFPVKHDFQQAAVPLRFFVHELRRLRRVRYRPAGS